MAITTFWTAGPRIDAMASARISCGKASRMSISRSRSRSTFPPQYALITPSRPPIVQPANDAVKPTKSAMRAPYMIRLITSRPNSSVPNQCSALGRANCCA